MASVWSGHVTFGLLSLPVSLYSGARSSGISFNMLHRTDKSRLKQQYVCQADGQVVDRDDITKGYEFRKDEYITIDPEEIKRITPASGKTMEILEFIDAEDLDPIYFESSYYILPEEAGKHAYDLLVVGLLTSNRVAIAKVTMHNREYTTFIRPHAGGLMLHTMYYQDEVKKVEGFGTKDFDTLRDSVKPEEVALVHQIIDGLTDAWEPEKYKDSFQENLKKLIEAKLEGGEFTLPVVAKVNPVVDLMAALKQSLEQMEKQKKEKKEKKEKKGKAA